MEFKMIWIVLLIISCVVVTALAIVADILCDD